MDGSQNVPKRLPPMRLLQKASAVLPSLIDRNPEKFAAGLRDFGKLLAENLADEVARDFKLHDERALAFAREASRKGFIINITISLPMGPGMPFKGLPA